MIRAVVGRDLSSAVQEYCISLLSGAKMSLYSLHHDHASAGHHHPRRHDLERGEQAGSVRAKDVADVRAGGRPGAGLEDAHPTKCRRVPPPLCSLLEFSHKKVENIILDRSQVQ
jgi:hypothetical protein